MRNSIPVANATQARRFAAHQCERCGAALSATAKHRNCFQCRRVSAFKMSEKRHAVVANRIDTKARPVQP